MMDAVFGFIFLFNLLVLFLVLDIRLEIKKISEFGISAPKKLIFIISGEERTMVSLKSNNKLPIEIVAKDKFGNKAELDSAPTWSFDPSSLGQFTVSENGMSAEFVPSGEIGKGLVNVSGLENGQPLTGSLEIEVIAGDAVSFTVEPGMPTEV